MLIIHTSHNNDIYEIPQSHMNKLYIGIVMYSWFVFSIYGLNTLFIPYSTM